MAHEASAPSAPAQRTTTGIPGLDSVLHGGLIAGQLYMIEGSPGAGKTTLALQFLLEGARLGESCLYVSLSETASELRAGARSHGWSLDGIEVLVLAPDQDDAEDVADQTMYHPSEVDLHVTSRKVMEAVERLRPQRMALDSLSELRLLAESPLRYRRQVMRFKQFFEGRGCTALLLADRPLEGSVVQVQSVAHGVISIDLISPPYGPALRRLQVVKLRGSDFVSGLQDARIVGGGFEVFPRLQAAEDGMGSVGEAVPSGVAALDRMFGGGISRGTCTLLIGPPGTGKTTIAMQFAAAAAARGDHAAVFSFEESRELLLVRCTDLGMALSEGTGPGKVEVRRIEPKALTPGHFAELIRCAVEVNGARVVVIDSLNGYTNAMPERRALMVQLHDLLNYLNGHGVATFLIAAAGGGTAAEKLNALDASYLADSVVMFRLYEQHGEVRKAVAMLKKRSGRHETAVRELRLDNEGVHLSEPLLQLRGVMAGWLVEQTAVAAAPPA